MQRSDVLAVLAGFVLLFAGPLTGQERKAAFEPATELAKAPTHESKTVVIDANQLLSDSRSDALNGTILLSDQEALIRGPIHEAFAIPRRESYCRIEQLPVAGRAPPEQLREARPAMPGDEGDWMWAPGYWSWDEQRRDFVWVSGFWRRSPEGRRWKPGEWSLIDGSYRWLAGFWFAENDDSTVVTSTPPQPVSQAPTVTPPSDNHFWRTGYWEPGEGTHDWKAGTWMEQRAGRVWRPAAYYRRAGGTVFVSGFWDLLPAERGQLFASVAFYRPVDKNQSFRFVPKSRLADSATLMMHLFVRENDPTFYYGNYFSNGFAKLGYRPWYTASARQVDASPLFRYYESTYRRSGIDFLETMKFYEQSVRANPSRFSNQLVFPVSQAEGTADSALATRVIRVPERPQQATKSIRSPDPQPQPQPRRPAFVPAPVVVAPQVVVAPELVLPVPGSSRASSRRGTPNLPTPNAVAPTPRSTVRTSPGMQSPAQSRLNQLPRSQVRRPAAVIFVPPRSSRANSRTPTQGSSANVRSPAQGRPQKPKTVQRGVPSVPFGGRGSVVNRPSRGVPSVPFGRTGSSVNPVPNRGVPSVPFGRGRRAGTIGVSRGGVPSVP